MEADAEKLLNHLKDEPNVSYKLLAIWVSITTNYISNILTHPIMRETLKRLVVTLLDAELTDRERKDKDESNLKDGILPKQEGHTNDKNVS